MEHRVKRSRIETEDEVVDDDNDGGETAETSMKLTTKKHTLDSDEEDETDTHQRLDMDKVEGQEESTLEYEGQVKIMPFNMKDDLEEGHFDANGTFIFDKKEDVIKDAWLDNIEWDNVKNAAGKHWGKLDDEEGKKSDDEKEVEPKDVYRRLLELLNEKETIAGALKRLNSEKRMNAAEERKRRWAAKKSGANVQEDEKSKQVAELTVLADSLVSLGNMEAYQLNQEGINALLNALKTANRIPGAKKATMDMFSEE
uniref:CD2 antigen cytoplasmic tail-binding protein 2 n=1 Tax=Globodera rostochiensis TaxID=31243 RepID=A0A914I4W2_GLORO